MCNLSQSIENRGMKKANLDIAKKMIDDNLPVGLIERYTNLPTEIIKQLSAAVEFERDIRTMSELGEMIKNNGIKMGTKDGIKKAIDLLRDLGFDDDIIARKIKEKFELIDEEMQLFF